MDQRTSEIVDHIFEERQRLGDNIAALEQKVRAAATWQSYFARKPWAMLGLAFGSGVLVSSFFASKER